MVLEWFEGSYGSSFQRDSGVVRLDAFVLDEKDHQGRLYAFVDGSKICLVGSEQGDFVKPGDFVKFEIGRSCYNPGSVSYASLWDVEDKSRMNLVVWEERNDAILLLGWWYGALFDSHVFQDPDFVRPHALIGHFGGYTHALVHTSALPLVQRVFGDDVPVVKAELPEIDGLHPFKALSRSTRLEQRKFLLDLIAVKSR